MACCLAVGVLVFAGSAQAQVTGTIQGYVADESGGRLPGASVVVRNVGRGVERSIATNSEGFYSAPALQPGEYEIVASLQGFKTVDRQNIRLLVGQLLDINFTLAVATVEEVITVTAETPLIEVSRSSTAKYVTEEEIDNLPISGRNYVDFALLSPTVKPEPVRGGISLSGQKGISSGLAIDGTEAKSAFFGYGRGGEATENDGLVIAQDTVQEFQVIINGFAPEYGRNGGGYVNVVTKSGTNEFRGSAFGFFRNEGMVANLQRTPAQELQGIPEDDPRFEPTEFKRYNWGASIGGPIKKDRTHFFASVDFTKRDEPFIDNIDGPGQYDAIASRFPGIVEGYTRNSDGTASGQFTTKVDNMIVFGKIDHQLNDRNTLTLRYNYTDYQRESDAKSQESLKTEKAHSAVVQLVSVIGANTVNEFRFQYATDDLDRHSNLDPGDPVANFRIEQPVFESFGKPDFLPIFVREKKLQFQNNLSYRFGSHDMKFGVDWNIDDLSEYFAGSADGRYDFRTVDDFLANNDRRVRIYFGDVSNPNFDVQQQTVGLYAQDSWKPNAKLTVNYGVRWEGTFNPDGIDHVLSEGTEIPDDLNNWAPRIGFTYDPTGNGTDVFRGGVGIFYSRTPTLIFFNVYQDNGVYPNYGRVTVSPGQTGHVPLGTAIDNENPPTGLRPALAYMIPNFQDPKNTRVNLGYERQLGESWSAGVDLMYSRGDDLQSTYDTNVFEPTLDADGRYVYPDGRPSPEYDAIMVRDDFGYSNYYAATFSIQRRFLDGYQLQAHYTWSQDKDTDSNERSATSVTVTNPFDPDHDYGFAERDVTHRFVLSGLAQLPANFKVSGILTAQSGSPYTARDDRFNLMNHPGFGVADRAVINGVLSDRNAFRNDSFFNLDLRLSWTLSLGERASLELIGDGFNVLNTGNFTNGNGDFTGTGGIYVLSNGSLNPNFGVADGVLGNQRQFQLGARVQF